jgi:ribosomal-protein-alanine N-acetyltransferase
VGNVVIADLTLEYLDAVHAIEKRTFSIPWSKDEFRSEITGKEHAYYKAALIRGAWRTRVAGYAGLWHILNEGHITNFAVDEPYRRQGIGSMLLAALIELAAAYNMIGLTLEVRAGNDAALALYAKYGFKPEGLRRNYYTDPREDAVIMWKYFKEEDNPWNSNGMN